MLGHCLRRWPSINTTLGQRIVCAEILLARRLRRQPNIDSMAQCRVFDGMSAGRHWIVSNDTHNTVCRTFTAHKPGFFLFASHLKVVLFTGPDTSLTFWVFCRFQRLRPNRIPW